MKLAAKPNRSHERGQSLVELAISLTVMLMLLAGAVTFGMALFSYVAIRDAAQEGALFGSFNPYSDANGNGKYDAGEVVNTAGIRERVRAASTSPLNLGAFPDDQILVTTTNSGADMPCEGLGGGGGANGVEVTVLYDYPIIMPYIGGIIGSQVIHLRAEVTDTILEPRCP